MPFLISLSGKSYFDIILEKRGKIVGKNVPSVQYFLFFFLFTHIALRTDDLEKVMESAIGK